MNPNGPSESEKPWVLVVGAGAAARVAEFAPRRSLGAQPRVGQKGRQPLIETLRRARRIGRPDRVVVVECRRRPPTWPTTLVDFALENVLLQPEDRGTAAEVLLGLLHVRRCDPEATVVILPADLPIECGADFEEDVRRAVERSLAADCRITILPGGPGEVSGVVAGVGELIRLYEHATPNLLAVFLHELVARQRWQPWHLARMYQMIIDRDFERDVLPIVDSVPSGVVQLEPTTGRRPQLKRGIWTMPRCHLG